jgi:rhodanese-related sulfurtransferase
VFQQIEQVMPADWRRWVAEHDAVVLDVREPFEWARGTLPDAATIPLASLPGALDGLSPQRPVLVICRSGNRSEMAARYLAQAGFHRVANLWGGLVALGMA